MLNEFVAYDTETTGLDAETDAIVEIGAVRFRDGAPVEAWSTLVDPQRPIPADSTAVHGITEDMIAGKPTIAPMLEDFATFCGAAPMVAHNARFDYKFVLAAIKQHKTRAPKGELIDSFALAKRVVSGLPNYRLSTLIRHFDIPSTQFHRAEEDAAYCGKVFQEIVSRLEAVGEPTDLASLLELTGRKGLVFPQLVSDQEQLGLF